MTNHTNKDLVVVGSSAGGVGALSTLVSTLDKAFPAPVVLAQHLDPQRPSQLGSILERRSVLPIVIVSEHSPTPLESGKVYVVPSNRHVVIADGHVHLEADHADRPKPSVDMLLSSAAASYGEHLIAVILTGSGSDGAAGAVDVKNAGGLVIIQNPQTALYPSMPLSLPPTAVDHVVEMEQVGPLLFDLLKGVNLPPVEKVEDPLRDLLNQVSGQSNVDFQHYKSSTILRRISRRMAVTRNANLHDYADYLRSHPEENKELVKAFLIRVTGFFRDPEAFDFLRQTVMPTLIEQGEQNGRMLRMWSAGCATGEEAYSLALLLADLLGNDFSQWNVKIFATDLATDAVTFARRGIYPENVLSDLPNDYQARFFDRIDHGFQVAKALRQAVIFGQQDISRGVPFPRIDLVSCRNLLIYLKPELQQAVLDLFAYSLQQSHGYLFLGKAETARPTKGTFELINKKWKIYRCLSGPLNLPIRDSAFSAGTITNARREPRRGQISTSNPHASELTQPEIEIAHLRRINETIMRYTAAAVVIIDRSYRILTINVAARRLLSVRDLAYDQDFLHSIRGLPYHDVRRAIDTSFREHTSVNLEEIQLDHSSEGSGRYVNLTITNMHVEQGSPELAVITAIDVTEQVQLKQRLDTTQQEHGALVTELNVANKRFSTMNKELQDANEELQAANEELMLTQEELQATNEEFEATNEELQATNEELETNNEELQATNEELQTTNDELTSRTAELQELARQNRIEQLQLSILLERYPHFVMVLNAHNLTVNTVNPVYTEWLEGREVVGLPVSDVFGGKDLGELIKSLKTVARESQTIKTKPLVASVGDHENRTAKFVHTIVPITDAESASVNRLFLYSEKAE
ncbi:MAG TPA: CheR family methyltransferase [Pyrinomonadaceae bacterium]|jgi:two-component system CheB/CheR fusion protein|nr:CheR family methyltransferase [Pyrinomonadaceae bacterium]